MPKPQHQLVNLKVPTKLLSAFDRYAAGQVRDRSSLLRELMAERVGLKPNGEPLDDGPPAAGKTAAGPAA